MRLTKIECRGYKRFITSGIADYFKLTPAADQIIVLGSNGSGKSSLFALLTPMPAASSDFIKGGYVETHWEHRGHRYALRSDFGSGPTHSFICDDGEDLNPGGTGKVQSQLVLEHFGIDAPLQSLLSGKSRDSLFTQMSANQRRDWIMRISGGDFTYAMRLFDRINTRMRDAMGAIRHHRNRLVELEKDKVTQDDIDAYQAQLDTLNLEFGRVHDIERNLSQLGNTEHRLSLDDLTRAERDIATRLTAVLNRVQRSLAELQDLGVNHDTYRDDTQSLQNELSLRKENIAHLLESLKQLKDQQSMLQSAGSIEQLTQDIASLQAQNEAIAPTITFDIADPQAAYTAWRDVSVQFNSIMAQWDYDAMERHTDAALQDARQSRMDLESWLQRAHSALDKEQHRLIHLRNTDNVECPRCNHTWKPGLQHLDPVEIEQQITKITRSIDVAQKRLADRVASINEMERVLSIKQDYAALCRYNPVLNDLWTRINESGALRDPKINFKLLIDDWVRQCSDMITLHNNRTQLTTLTERADMLRKLSDNSVSLNERCQLLEDQIDAAYRQHDGLLEQLSQQQRIQHLVKDVEQCTDEARRAADHLNALVTSALYHDGIARMRAVKTQLNDDTHGINSLLIRARNAKSVLDELTTSLDTLSKEHRALVVLSKELSPKEGLIGELLNSITVRMLDDMNTVINAVWHHPLEVEPCGIDDSGMDFKFPLNVKNGEMRPADISLGSTSQQDIIDFVFELIVRKYLGMSDYPLYLDEPFTSLDEAHRLSVVHYLKQLVETDMCSQVFVISHYAETHTSFPNAEYVVTDKTNITVPSVYNQNVVME